MARTKSNQRSANRVAVPMDTTGGRPPSKITILIFATSIVAAVWAAAMMTPFGRVAYVYFFAYSEYYMGVISLVALSITIMIGLVATDRLVLSIRQRVLLQSAHRTTGVIAVAALVMHLWTKVMEGHIRTIDMFIPFLSPGYNRLYVGLGTISGLIMVTVMWTGIVRSRFVGRGKPWMWRSIHAISYLMWPIALVHGLSAGRAAATWVTVSYVVCVLGVLIGLAVRVSVSLNRRKDFASTSTGSIKPVGSLVPTTTPPARSRMSGRRDDTMAGRAVADRENTPVAVLEPWTPAAPPATPAPPAIAPVSARPAPGPVSARPAPISAPPMSPMPYDEDPYRRGDRPRRHGDEEMALRGRRYADEEPPAPRGRRYADEEPPAPRQRRGARYDEAATAMPRYAAEEPAPRSRRRADEYDYEDEPRRGRRHAEEEPRYEPEPPRRASRYADDDVPRRRTGDVRTTGEFTRPDYQTGEFRTGDVGYDRPAPPRSRSARYADDVPPSGRRSANVDRADSGRHSRSEFVDLADPADPWGAAQADANYMPPDETPTLVDMASRRARRAEQQQERGRRGARRSKSREDDVADDQYWRQLRGEAQ
jgi:hypothetical protein